MKMVTVLNERSFGSLKTSENWEWQEKMKVMLTLIILLADQRVKRKTLY